MRNAGRMLEELGDCRFEDRMSRSSFVHLRDNGIRPELSKALHTQQRKQQSVLQLIVHLLIALRLSQLQK